MIGWAITYLVHSTLLIAAVWLACRFVRSASARETLWKVALVAPLVTATMPSVVPARAVIPQAAPARITLPAAAAAPASTRSSAESERIERAQRLDIRTVALPLWLAGAALLLLRLFGGRLLFARALRDRVDLPGEHDRLERLRAATRCRAAIRLTESGAVGSPIAMPGWEIVVPRGAFARLSDEQKETILTHEIAHLQRRDPLWLLAGETIKALLFVQPLNRLLHAKMKECAELLCDDVAVRTTSNPRALAETLAALAGAYAGTPRAVAAMAEGGSNLTARVTRVLAREGERERPLRLASQLAIAAVAVVTLAAFAPSIGMARAAGTKRASALSMSIHFDDGVLSRTFNGPYGEMNTRLTAKDVDIAEDGSDYRFTSRDGFLRVRQTASRGPLREIDATPAADLQPVVHYRVGGSERPLDDDARLAILSAFRAEKAYAATVQPEGVIRITPRQRRPDPSRRLKTWGANVELVGTRDHIPTALRVRAAGVRYDEATGEVFFEPGASLDVEETIGGETRTFRRDDRELVWSGRFGEVEVSSWLARILHEQTKLPMDIAERMGRE